MRNQGMDEKEFYEVLAKLPLLDACWTTIDRRPDFWMKKTLDEAAFLNIATYAYEADFPYMLGICGCWMTVNSWNDSELSNIGKILEKLELLYMYRKTENKILGIKVH